MIWINTLSILKTASSLFICAILILPSNIKKQKNMDSKITLGSLPTRSGVRPKTTDTNPHTQLTQQPEDLSYINELQDWAFQLSYIKKQPSQVSVP